MQIQLTLLLETSEDGGSMRGLCKEIPEVIAIGMRPMDTLRTLVGCIITHWKSVTVVDIIQKETSDG
jgi:hypothetical protein